jgi:hypothetical protein
MSTLVARLRAEVDEDVNEPLDRLLDEAAGRVEALEMTLVEMLAKCSNGTPDAKVHGDKRLAGARLTANEYNLR